MLSDKDKCLLGYLEATHKMWTWLAEHPEAGKIEAIRECMGEPEYNMFLGNDYGEHVVWSNCFLCEYVSNTKGGYDKRHECLNCYLCPLVGIAWDVDEDYGGSACQTFESPYDTWESSEDPDEISKAALAIAEGAQQAIYKLTKDKE